MKKLKAPLIFTGVLGTILTAAYLFLAPNTVQSQGTAAPMACPQFFSATGQPLAGGLLGTFRSGTLIPQATFTDATLSTPNPTPVILDAGGYPTNPSGGCGLFLDPTLTYTFTLRNAQGVQVWSVDGITSGNFAVLLSSANVWTGVQTFTGGIVVTGPATFQNVGINGTAHINNLQCTTFQNAACVDASNTQQWPGSDAGAWINAAYASLSATGGDILVASGVYSASTAIVFASAGKPARMLCAPGGASTITYTGTGTAFTYNVGAGHLWAGGIENCALVGPGSSTSTTGVTLGGTQGAEGAALRSVKITGFGIGQLFGSNTFLVKCDHCIYINNGQNLEIPAGLTNFGESINYSHTVFANDQGNSMNNNCVKVDGIVNNLTFESGSFDNCQYTQNNGQVAITDTHFENPNTGMTTPFVQMNGGTLSITNPDMLWNDVAPSPSAVVGCSSGVLDVVGASYFSVNTLTSAVTLAGNCEFHELGTKNLTGFTNPLANGSSGAYTEWGNKGASNVLFGAGNLLLSGSHLSIGPLNQNYFTFVPVNPATFRNVAVTDPGANFTMGSTLNTGTGVYQSALAVPGCTTAASQGAMCTMTATWPAAFTNTNYSVSCTPTGTPTAYPSAPWVSNKTTTTSVLTIQAVTSAAAGYVALDCVAVQQ